MNLLQIGVIAAWAVAAALFAAYATAIASEITYVTLADGRRTERKIPLVFRLLLPFVPNLLPLVRRPSFEKARTSADEMIMASGLEGLLTGEEFVALKFLVPLVCGAAFAAFFFVLASALPESPIADMAPMAALMGFLLFYAWPLMWLRKTLKRRHAAIEKALPFVLDLLTLSVEAGMDFMSALSRNCSRRRLDPLNEELSVIVISITSEELHWICYAHRRKGAGLFEDSTINCKKPIAARPRRGLRPSR